MNFETWITFTAASCILLIMPGPTILTVISYSVTHGHRVRLPLMSAVALGDSTALALSLLGLGALLAKSAMWFQVIKWAGGLYLIYLGIRLFRSGVSAQTLPEADENLSSWKLFINTYLVTALNPKGIIFFVAFLPHFISPHGDTIQQMWILAITFVILATLNTFLYVAFAGTARQLLSSPAARRAFNLTGGTLLSVAGLWALSAKRTLQENM
jgi:threonine/homoserine/homoserine lactone efflux protein